MCSVAISQMMIGLSTSGQKQNLRKTHNGQKTIITEQGDFHVAKMFAKAIGFITMVSTARAAHHLAAMGRYEEARRLMTEMENK